MSAERKHGIDLSELVASDILTLNDDPDTSMVTSLILHLLSEHSIDDALSLPLDDADRLHRQLHQAAEQNHHEQDLRFRPGRVLRSLTRLPAPRRHAQA